MTAPVADDVPPWNRLKRVAFRIAFAYFVLYHIDETYLGLLGPIFRVLNAPMGPRAVYRRAWDPIARWIAIHLFSADASLLATMNSNTDSGIHYARVGSFLVAAIVIGAVWSALARRRDYVALDRWLSDFLRFALALSLFPYAVSKVFPVQMLPGHLFTTYLLQPLGDKSPAGLLWAFVGYSVPYQMFAGFTELLASLLLLTRRTLAIGALVALVATVNVAAFNLFYDVDIKLFSLNL